MTALEFTKGLLQLIAPFAMGGLSWLLKRYLQARPRVNLYMLHSASVTMKNDDGNIANVTFPDGQTRPLIINTHSVVISNSGKETATDVRLVHLFIPKSFQVFPPAEHKVFPNENGGGEIIFPKLVSGEQVTITYVYYPPLNVNQTNFHVKFDGGFARKYDVIPSPRPNKVLIWLILILSFVGGSFLLYKLAIFAITATGIVTG